MEFKVLGFWFLGLGLQALEDVGSERVQTLKIIDLGFSVEDRRIRLWGGMQGDSLIPFQSVLWSLKLVSPRKCYDPFCWYLQVSVTIQQEFVLNPQPETPRPQTLNSYIPIDPYVILSEGFWHAPTLLGCCEGC